MTWGSLALPWNIPWNSMELLSTLVSLNRISPRAMEFHGTLRTPFSWSLGSIGILWNSMELGGLHLKWFRVPWNSMEYSMEFHGTMMPLNQISPRYTEFYGTIKLTFQITWVSLGLPCTIPWHFMELLSRQIKYHRVPTFPMTPGFHWIPCNIPWNITWNSMKLWCRHCHWHQFSLDFHLIPWN